MILPILGAILNIFAISDPTVLVVDATIVWEVAIATTALTSPLQGTGALDEIVSSDRPPA